MRPPSAIVLKSSPSRHSSNQISLDRRAAIAQRVVLQLEEGFESRVSTSGLRPGASALMIEIGGNRRAYIDVVDLEVEGH